MVLELYPRQEYAGKFRFADGNVDVARIPLQ